MTYGKRERVYGHSGSTVSSQISLRSYPEQFKRPDPPSRRVTRQETSGFDVDVAETSQPETTQSTLDMTVVGESAEAEQETAEGSETGGDLIIAVGEDDKRTAAEVTLDLALPDNVEDIPDVVGNTLDFDLLVRRVYSLVIVSCQAVGALQRGHLRTFCLCRRPLS